MLGLCPIVEDAAPRRRQPRAAGSPGDKKNNQSTAMPLPGRVLREDFSPFPQPWRPREGGLRVTNAGHCLEKGGGEKKIQYGGERFSSLCLLLLLFPPVNGERCWTKGISFGAGISLSPTRPGGGG